MPTIAEVRAKFPQYDNMSDEALASALHQKFYSDMPESDFRQRIGLPTAQPTENGFAPRDVREAEPTREQMKGAYAEQAKGVRDRQWAPVRYLDTAMRGLARGIPFADDAAAGMDYLTGGSDSFTQAKDKQEAMSHADDSDRTALSVGSQLVGGMAMPGGEMLRGGSLAARTLKSAGYGATVGGLYGAGEGATLDERAGNATKGAGFGLVGGAAVPLVVGAAGRAASAVKDAVKPFYDAAGHGEDLTRSALARDAAAQAQRLEPHDFNAAQASGQRPMVVDTGGGNTKSLFRWAANVSPEARATAEAATGDRFLAQSQEAGDYISGMSRAGGRNPEQIHDELRRASRIENDANYQRAYQEGNDLVASGRLTANRIGNGTGHDGLWTPELDRLSQSDLVREAIRRATSTSTNEAAVQGGRAVRAPNPFEIDPVTQELRLSQAAPDGSTVRPTLEFWDQVQRNLRDVAGEAGRGGNNNLARQAGTIRDQLNRHLDDLVPSFGEARTGAARFFGADDALEAGQNFFKQNGRHDMAEAQRAFDRMSPSDQALFREGFVAEQAAKAYGTNQNQNIAGAMMNNPRDVGKATMALGTDDAHALDAYMTRERIMTKAKNILGGSPTYQNMRDGIINGVAGGALGTIAGGGDITSPQAIIGAIIGGGSKAARGKIFAGVDQRVADAAMRILTSEDPAVLTQALQQSGQPQAVTRLLRRIESMGTRGAVNASAGDRPPAGDNENDIVVHPRKGTGYAEGGPVRSNPDFANQLLGEVVQRFAGGGSAQPTDIVSLAKTYEQNQKVLGGLSHMPRSRHNWKYFGAGGVVEDIGKGTIPVYKRGGLACMSNAMARSR